MGTKVRTIYIELRAVADRLRADLEAAAGKLDRVGQSGKDAGRQIADGMNKAHESMGKIALDVGEATLAIDRVIAATARYSAAAAASGATTQNLVNSYRALRIALSPEPFTIATVAVGILAEETIRLTNARAKLIAQQSLIAASSGRSVGSVELLDSASGIAGANSGRIQSLFDTLRSRSQSNGQEVNAGLSALGVSGSAGDPAVLGRIAAAFSSITDPAARATAAVNLFGGQAREALDALDGKFANASDAAQRWGLQLDSLSRSQIFTFRQELLQLKNALTDFSGVNAALEKFEQYAEQAFAAADDGSRRAVSAFDELIRRVPGLQALGGAMQDLKSLSPAELKGAQRKDLTNGLAADQIFAQAQLAHYRDSQTLEGQKALQEAAKKREESAYKKLTDDAYKRDVNPNDPSLLSDDARLSLAAAAQSARALADAIGDTVKKLKDQKDAQDEAKKASDKLTEFQSGAADRLNAAFQSSTLQGIKDPTARSMYEGSVQVRQDSDKTSAAEKTGRADIATQNFRQALAAEQQKWAAGVLADLVKANLFALDAAGKELQRRTDGVVKDAEAQRKADTQATGDQRDSGEHAIRLAGIQSGPNDEISLAKSTLDIRLQTVTAERAIIDAHRESYTVAQGDLEDARLAKEEKDAELSYTEKLAEIEKQRQQAAIAAGGAYQQHLEQLQQELESLSSIGVTSGNIRDIEMARKALNDQILQAQVQQTLALGTLKDGWNSFWLSMQEQAEKPGRILFDGMNSALDKSSEQLAKLATGQKTSFGKTFQSVGQGMTQQSFKSMAQFGLGKLGGLFGIHGSAGKPDGTAANPYHVVSAGSPPSPGGIPGMPAMAGSAGSGPASNALADLMKSISGSGGFLGKIFGSSGGGGISFMADGGDADPGKIYGVAEAGEAEIVSPKSSARITPLSKAGLGGNFTYHVDARGADLGAENRVMRAIEYAHNSAVTNGVKASAERAKRTPKRSS